MNEGKNKTTIDYKEKSFAIVSSMLKRFLQMKKKVDPTNGEVLIWGHKFYH